MASVYDGATIQYGGTMAEWEERNFLSEISRLHRAGEELAQLLPAGAEDALFDGFDEGRQVRITIDRSGQVTDVEIAPEWQSTLDLQGLGPSVLAAAQDAVRQRFESWAADLDHAAATSPAQAHAQAPALFASPAGHRALPNPRGLPNPRDPAAAADLREMYHLVVDAAAQLEVLARATEEAADLVVEGHSRQHRVTVTLERGELTDIRFDLRWLRNSSPDDVEAHVLAACHAAYREAADRGPERLLKNPTLAELRARISDPAALLRRLGLGGH